MKQQPPSVITAHFSHGMLSRHVQSCGATIDIIPLTKDEAIDMANDILARHTHPRAASAIGFANTAEVLSNDLGVDVPQNRATLNLGHGESMLLCHINGRLEEYARVLPAGMTCSYFEIQIQELA